MSNDNTGPVTDPPPGGPGRYARSWGFPLVLVLIVIVGAVIANGVWP